MVGINFIFLTVSMEVLVWLKLMRFTLGFVVWAWLVFFFFLFLALISCIHKLNVIVRRHVEKSGWLGISLWNVVHYFRNLSSSCPEKQHPLLPTLSLQNTENENIHQGTNLYVLNYSVQRLFTGYFICSITEARVAEWTTDVKLNWNAFAGIEIHSRVQRILSMVKKNSSYLEKYQVF